MSKPVVDGLEQDLEGQAAVLRIDITSKVGRDAARAHDVGAVPTFLVFDGEGTLILRQSGRPNSDVIRETVAGLLTTN